ncbi:MAG: class I SAM-dependent methyltransferase [Bacteroidales bacterium]|nr:class I SAM-dependent methyltransferase [Bacteroidales bacterium]
MKNNADIFGIAFEDFLGGNAAGVIRVKTMLSGFTEDETLPVAYFFRSFDEMPEWEQRVLNNCRGSILDVGAGAGAHSLELQHRSYEVTAVDTSPGAVDTMKQRGVRKAYLSDIMTFSGQKFDTLLFLMNGIGMACDLKGLKKLLLHVKSLLNPGGVVWIESTDILYMYREEDGSILLPMGDRYYGEIRYQLSYGGQKGRPFRWLFVDEDHLCHTARSCGFTPEIAYYGERSNYIAALHLP